jgi:hypothetical protein
MTRRLASLAVAAGICVSLLIAATAPAAGTQMGGASATLTAVGCDLTVTLTWPHQKHDQYNVYFFVQDNTTGNNRNGGQTISSTATSASKTFSVSSGGPHTFVGYGRVESSSGKFLAFSYTSDQTFGCAI